MEKLLFTSESVTEGHPDKMCDAISDAILDALLEQDPMSRVACETATTTGLVLVMGEITTKAYVDIQKIVRETVREIGYTRGKYGFDALIVGSDQVWRPMYNYNIEDCFLSFVSHMNLKRVAYAASFGTDKWEFTQQQTEQCAVLAKRFDGISVREKSGVALCNKYLGVNATHVLDPTLLMKSQDYIKLCSHISKREPFIFAYVLDESEEKIKSIVNFAERRGLPYFIKGADNTVSDDDTIELWLSYFRDAAFVVTDSFHGTAFSIIFNKDFYVF